MKRYNLVDEIDVLQFGKRKPKKPDFWDWLAIIVFVVLIYILGAGLWHWRLINIGDSMYMWVRK